MPPVPPCEYCGEHFITWEMFDAWNDDSRQMAVNGEWCCPKPECMDAESHCIKCKAELPEDLTEDELALSNELLRYCRDCREAL